MNVVVDIDMHKIWSEPVQCCAADTENGRTSQTVEYGARWSTVTKAALRSRITSCATRPSCNICNISISRHFVNIVSIS